MEMPQATWKREELGTLPLSVSRRAALLSPGLFLRSSASRSIGKAPQLRGAGQMLLKEDSDRLESNVYFTTHSSMALGKEAPRFSSPVQQRPRFPLHRITARDK